MRPTAVVFSIVVAFGVLLSAAAGGTAESRLGDIKLPPGFRIAPNADVPNAISMTIGYRVSLARLEGNHVASQEVFADGWLQSGQVWGRPVDVQ